MANSDKYKVKESWMGVWVHKGPNKSSKQIGVIYGKDNKKYEVTERKNKYWLHIPEEKGWVCEKDSDGTTVMKKVESKSKKMEFKEVIETKKKKKEVEEESYAYVPTSEVISVSSNEFTSSLEQNFTISNLRGIFGMPYQFMASVDPRLTDATDAIGRKYAKEIVTSLPLLLIRPGKPVFMAGYTKNDKKTILGDFLGAVAGQESKITSTVLNTKFGKYYSLEYADKDYFEYVNPMCRVAARVMNLHKEEIDNCPLDTYNWYERANKNFSKFFSVYRDCTAWYCQSESSISDTFSNDTAESMIASTINSTVSDAAREINFLLGSVNAKTKSGSLLDKFTSTENYMKNMENVEDTISSMLGDSSMGSIFRSITNSALTVMQGGKLVFPKLWASSDFSRSYNINLKLVSPDGDDLSIYLNIIVPMLHLLGLVLPREAKDNKGHGYISPFLVRAFYKGYFNVDMGLITNLSFSKGTDSAWTLSGIPTVVDVNLEITDLYSDMYLSNTDNILRNIILLDYISNLCGVNINEVDVRRGIDLFLTQNVENPIKDTWRMKIYGNMNQWVSNKVQRIFGRF